MSMGHVATCPHSDFEINLVLECCTVTDSIGADRSGNDDLDHARRACLCSRPSLCLR